MSKNKGGRPVVGIDWRMVEELCDIHCTGEEIAGVVGVDYDTLSSAIRREHGMSFSEYFRRHSAGGRVKLRQAQYETAMAGNVTMLKWLGKQYLGQYDKVEQRTTTTMDDDTQRKLGLASDILARVKERMPE